MLTRQILSVLLMSVPLTVVLALTADEAKPGVVLAVYIPTGVVLVALLMLAHVGRAKLAACAITVFAWALVSVVVCFSGGIGTHGVSYIAVAMIAGTALGARAGLAAGAICIASTGVALVAEHQRWLPTPIVPGSMSSFIAISFAIAVVTLLHLAAIKHIDAALEANKVALREREAARAENEARRCVRWRWRSSAKKH